MSVRASEMPETTAELVELITFVGESREVTLYAIRESIKITVEKTLFLFKHIYLSGKENILNK